jgi:hypothetical protein
MRSGTLSTIQGWGQRRDSVLVTLTMVTLLKCVLFAALTAGHLAHPFVGDNTVHYIFPTAERLLHSHTFNDLDSRKDSHIGPGYPFFLAIIRATGISHDLIVTVIVQMFADLAGALCLYACAVMMGSPAVGAWSGLLWLLYPPAIVLSTWITQESVFTALLIASLTLALASDISAKGRPGLAFLGGIAMGLATLFRATPELLPVFFLPFWARQRRWLDAAAFIGGMALCIGPWAIRNQIVLHDRILVSTGAGAPFLLGTSEEQVHQLSKKGEFYNQASADGRAAGIYKPTSERESDIDSWQIKLGLMYYKKRLQERPLSYIGFAVGKFGQLWYATDMATPRSEIALGIFCLPVLPLAFWQVWVWRKTNPRLFFLWGATILYFIAMHMALEALVRYMLPIFPLLLYANCNRIAKICTDEP